MTIEEKMMKELDRTLRLYETFYEKGNNSLADKIFEEFMAQAKLVQSVLGKTIEVVEGDDGHYKAVAL